MRRIDIFKLLKEKAKWNDRYAYVYSHVQETLNLENKSEKVRQTVKKEVVSKCVRIKERWDRANRIEKDFLEKNKDWLNESVTIVCEAEEPLSEQDKPGPSLGRPTTDFMESGDRSKRRKTEDLRKNVPLQQLTYATKASLRSSGKNVEAKLIDEALNTTPTRAKKNCSAWKRSGLKPLKPRTPEQALALTLNCNLSTADYQNLVTECKEANADIFPSVKRVRAAKRECYPPEDSIEVTDSSAKILLQPLLNHTAKRIVEHSKDVLDTLAENTRSQRVLISKWGCDGASNQSTYKQRSDDANLRDSSLIMTCLVPLQLFVHQEGEDNPEKRVVVWQNPRPSSTRYCRPIKFEYAKETPEIILQEYEDVTRQIRGLVPTECYLGLQEGSYKVTITHDLRMTMVDGKTINVLTETTSVQKCNLCGAAPKEMNQLDRLIRRPVNTEGLQYGITTLHDHIRFVEWMLHVCYRLEIKAWQVRREHKDTVDVRKHAIQDRLKSELGLLVDVVKQGSGTTNDGNTARRFFSDPARTAQITGLDKDLLKRCNVILRTMSCGYKVDTNAFQTYALETAKLYVTLYPWYYMPASVHKVLIHGAEVMRAIPLPIGMMSEEAQEARNKEFRLYRRDRARKVSRKATNEDILHIMLASSDPKISSQRKLRTKFSGSLSQDVLALLKPTETGSSTEGSGEE